MISSKQPGQKRVGISLFFAITFPILVSTNGFQFQMSEPNSRIQSHPCPSSSTPLRRRMVSQNTLPEPPPSSISRTSSPISKLPSFRINEQDDAMTAGSAFLRTVVQPIALLVSLSLLLAVALVGWEDYGATNLWPSRHMMTVVSSSTSATSSGFSYSNFGRSTIHGLGFGKSERQQILADEQQQQLQGDNNAGTFTSSSSLLPEIRAFNEVMEEHRLDRVARWHQQQKQSTGQQQQLILMESAVADLQAVLLQVLNLQTLVADYQWDQVNADIQESITPKLEPAATVVRRYLTDQLSSSSRLGGPDSYNIGYEEIGFDWGSCAWRHCGALADAQEALDELDHLLGVLDPPECLFCLDVVERSLRDMLAVVPAQFHAMEGIPAYKPYQSLHVSDDSGEFGGEDVLDQEYLKVLQELRSSGGGASYNDED